MKQKQMFGWEDLPIFTGTPMKAQDEQFRPKEEEAHRQPLPGLELTFGTAVPASKPVAWFRYQAVYKNQLIIGPTTDSFSSNDIEVVKAHVQANLLQNVAIVGYVYDRQENKFVCEVCL